MTELFELFGKFKDLICEGKATANADFYEIAPD
jgi:hypothetical protein